MWFSFPYVCTLHRWGKLENCRRESILMIVQVELMPYTDETKLFIYLLKGRCWPRSICISIGEPYLHSAIQSKEKKNNSEIFIWHWLELSQSAYVTDNMSYSFCTTI